MLYTIYVLLYIFKAIPINCGYLLFHSFSQLTSIFLTARDFSFPSGNNPLSFWMPCTLGKADHLPIPLELDTWPKKPAYHTFHTRSRYWFGTEHMTLDGPIRVSLKNLWNCWDGSNCVFNLAEHKLDITSAILSLYGKRKKLTENNFKLT